MPENSLNSPYIKEALTFVSGIVLAIVGLFTKKMFVKKETEDAERVSADDLARDALLSPLDEYRGPIVDEYRRQITDLTSQVKTLKTDLGDEHRKRVAHFENDIDDSQTLSKVVVQISIARGQLESVVENANISKFDYDVAVKNKDVGALITILNASYRSAARLSGVVKALKKAERSYSSLLEDSEAE